MTNQEPPRPSIFPRLLGVAAILAVHFFSLLVLMLVFCSVVPKYVEFFDLANTELPEMTILVVQVSFAFLNYWYLLVILCMPADAVIVMLLAFLAPKKPWILSAYSHLWLVAVIFLLLWVSVALCLPVHRLAEM